MPLDHEPCLRENVVDRFNDPLDACEVAGGLNKELLASVTLQYNKYVDHNLEKDSAFCGYP